VLCTFHYDIDPPSARCPHGAAVLMGSASSRLNLLTRSQSSRRYSPHGLRALTRVRAVHRRERKVEFREDYFDAMPDAESIDGKRTLARRIQIASDPAALCKLCQPCRRGKPFNWSKEEKTANGAILKADDQSSSAL
jgi:hypothetical protein